MKTKHTPGPWSLSAGYHKTMTGEPADWVVEDSKGAPIAFLSDEETRGPRYERDANASLIAAAPDLLLVARAIALWGGANLRNPTDLEAILNLAKDAVKKATGEV